MFLGSTNESEVLPADNCAEKQLDSARLYDILAPISVANPIEKNAAHSDAATKRERTGMRSRAS